MKKQSDKFRTYAILQDNSLMFDNFHNKKWGKILILLSCGENTNLTRL